MSGILLDTHALIWFAFDDARLSAEARQAIANEFGAGRTPAVSVITMIEIVYLVEKGRVPAETISCMKELWRAGRLALLPIDMSVVDALFTIERGAVPDMPDRIIAATASSRGLTLITRDERIRCALPSAVW